MKLLKNFLYNQIYQLFLVLAPLITVPYISRVLGTDGVGLFSYSSSYAQYFVLLGMIGIDLYGSRQIARSKNSEEKYGRDFTNIYTLQFITTATALIIYLIIFVGINKDHRMLYLAQGTVVVASMFDISWLFIGLEDMKSVVLRNAFVKIVGIILIFILVKKPSDIILYALIMGGSSVIGQGIMWAGFRKVVKVYKPTPKEVFTHLTPALGLFVSQLAIQIYVLLDRSMLGFMSDMSQVGLYANAQKTIRLALTLITSLGVVMLPRMSALYSEGKMDEFKTMIYKAFNFVNFMAFPMVFGLIAIADGFSLWFYGASFAGVGVLLQVGVLIIIAISWSNILGIQVMLPMDRERGFTISVVGGAVVNVIFNFILIIHYKAMGTTIASVIAEFTVTAIQIYLLRDVVKLGKIIKTAIKPLVGSVVMFLAIKIVERFVSKGIIATVIEVAVGVIVYIVVMIIIKDQFIKEANSIIKTKILKR
ncbi:flippase [Clostridium massiliamazoniense]|uniref:flippase n=1 Tax=Clostridium massiliamazoniense TaxID=1347366 RepID=UPI0006D7BFE5|nr:flippase [Clostridium massiliamazoniense]